MKANLLPNPDTILRRITVLPAPPIRAPGPVQPDWRQILARWIERSRQRRALADLDDRLLDDVGITPSEAAREIAKPFWR